MLCACLSSVELAYKHEPQCHRRPVRSADVLDVGHVMTILTMFEKSSKSHLLFDRHSISSTERSWPSSVRLRRERANSASGLPVLCDPIWHVFTKCDFRTFDFVTLLTGSGNENKNRAPLGHVVMFLVSNGEIRVLISLPVAEISRSPIAQHYVTF